MPGESLPDRRNGKLSTVQRKSVLAATESAACRDQLLGELAELTSEDELASWAQRILPNKNTLTAADTRLLEEAFASKLKTHGNPGNGEVLVELVAPAADARVMAPARERKRAREARGRRHGSARTDIEKSVLAFPEPRRIRDKQHLKFVSRQPCLICGRQPADAHHVRFAQPRALGRKVSDEFTVPLCRSHHREVHRRGDEASWWSEHGLDPLTLASALWRQTHPLPSSPQWSAANGSTVEVQNIANGKGTDGCTAIPTRPHDETKPIIPTDSQ